MLPNDYLVLIVMTVSPTTVAPSSVCSLIFKGSVPSGTRCAEKVLVTGSKDNQFGSGEPSDITALTVTVPVPVDPVSLDVTPLLEAGLLVPATELLVCEPVLVFEPVLVLTLVLELEGELVPAADEAPSTVVLLDTFKAPTADGVPDRSETPLLDTTPDDLADTVTAEDEVSPANTDSGTVNANPVTGDVDNSVIGEPFTTTSICTLTKPGAGADGATEPSNNRVTGASGALTAADGNPVDARLADTSSRGLFTTAVCSTVTFATSAGAGELLWARCTGSNAGAFV